MEKTQQFYGRSIVAEPLCSIHWDKALGACHQRVYAVPKGDMCFYKECYVVLKYNVLTFPQKLKTNRRMLTRLHVHVGVYVSYTHTFR